MAFEIGFIEFNTWYCATKLLEICPGYPLRLLIRRADIRAMWLRMIAAQDALNQLVNFADRLAKSPMYYVDIKALVITMQG